jgi:uncharacterized protein
MKKHGALVAVVSLFLVLAACRSESQPAPTPDPTEPPTVDASEPTAAPEPTPAPSPTPQPTPTPTPVPSPTPEPEVTPSPEPTPTPVPTPTPDPEREPVAWYIDSIASREYNGCCVERLRVYEQGANYTSWVIAYRSDDLRVTGLMAVPHGDGPFPAAIINHGYFPFDAYDTGYDTLREVRYMASNGYVAVAPNYRNYAGSDPGDHVWVPGYVYDVRNLVYALKEMPEVDGDRIGMMGHSMGGGITMQNIVSGADVKVAALYGTVTANEVERYEARVSRWASPGSDGPSQVAQFYERYGSPDESPEIYARMSSENYWDNVQIPVIIHHGDADFVTPLQWAFDIEAGLRDAGKTVEMHVYPGAGHSFNGADFDLYMARTLAFFDAVLRP